MNEDVLSWATDEFSRCDLGDRRRERRLIRVAAAAARAPSGTVTGTFPNLAEREAAYRFLENDDVDPEVIAESMYAATARRCAGKGLVVVAVDDTTLCLPDPKGQRGFGPVGSFHRFTTGMRVMNALALQREGAVLGLVDQQWWVRDQARIHSPASRHRGSKGDRRPLEARESYHWVRALRATAARLAREAPGCTPWFQLDRGGDCRAVLTLAEAGVAMTIRARTDRRLQFRDGTRGYLFSTLKAQPRAGHVDVDVPDRPGRPGREARLTVRCLWAPLALPLSKERRQVIQVYAVLVDEEHPPRGQQPIQWVLLTTRRLVTLVDALQVVSAYTLRWRVEDFHKAWKSGGCDIEASQLHKRDHFQRWATIMAAVAARIERIKHLSRTEPERPATDVFSQDEIDAIIVLRSEHRSMRYHPGDVPPVGEVARWVADLGGYMGSRNSPPPGTIVLRRGLERVSIAATLLSALRSGSRSGQS